MFKRFLIGALLVGVFAIAQAQQEPFNAGSTTAVTVLTNLTTQTAATNNVVWRASGEKFLRLDNGGSNTILWAFGSTVTSNLYIQGTTTTAFYNAECLQPGASTTPFDQYYFPNTNVTIAAIVTNVNPGVIVIHRGY